MTVLLPAWLQLGTYNAESDRSVPSGLLMAYNQTGGRGGVRRWAGNELQVLATGPATMQVAVKAGVAWVAGGYSATQGAYVVTNDSDVSLAITSAHSTLPRIDLVLLEVLDSTYSGASNTAALRVVQGTPASSPVAPAISGNYLILGEVRVNAAVTSIAQSAITDTRRYATAVGGTLPAKNQADRLTLPALAPGTEVLELDTGRVYQNGYGSGWNYAYGGSVPMDWVAATLKNGWVPYPGTGTTWRGSRYRKTATGQVEIQGMAKAGTIGAAVFTLPVGYRPALRLIFVVAVGAPDMSGRVDILPSGDVVFISSEHAFTAGAPNIWFSLNATFTADQ